MVKQEKGISIDKSSDLWMCKEKSGQREKDRGLTKICSEESTVRCRKTKGLIESGGGGEIHTRLAL